MNRLEIESVEQFYNLALPQTYKQFLSLMGKGADGYLRGSSVFFDELFDLHEWGLKFLKQHNIEMPENAFVFWMHQGYQAAFFKLSEGDDPPVYVFSEGNGHTTYIKDQPSLSAFFHSRC